jgi:dipeptidyl aminopeptidase/acylaminoacyl peptidase
MTLEQKQLSFLTVICMVAVLHTAAQSPKDKLRDDIVAMSSIGICRAGAFTSDGKDVVFLSNISGSPQIWKVPVEGGWPIQLTAFSDPVVAVSPSPKQNLIAFLVAPGGGLNGQIYLMKNDGSDIHQITKGGKTNNFLGSWSKDGTLFSFGSNEQNAAGVDAFIYDSKKGIYELTITNKGTGGITDFSTDNKTVLFTRLVSRGSNDLYLFDRVTKQEKLLTAHEGPGSFFGSIAPSDEVYLGSNRDRDLIAFAKYEDNRIRVLAEQPDAELSDLIINNAGTTVALVWNVSGKTKVTLNDIKSGKVTKELALPVELALGFSFSEDDQTMVFTGSGSREPLNIWTYSVAKNQFKKITDSPHPGIDLQALIAPTLISFKSFDGVQISGWLYTPKTGKSPFPTVISYHGGPESQSVPAFSALAQALLQRGLAYFMPNVRGSSGFGKKFMNLDNGPLRINGVKDIKAVSDYLINAGIARKGSLGIIGGSYGGYMVMAGVTQYPDMFAAGANLFGVVNFETFFKHTESWMAAISTVEYGDPATQADMLRELSPIHKASIIKTPLLVEHGANDTNVPVVEAEQVVEALKKNNIPVQYTLFPDEGHGWQKTNNRITSNVEIVEWFTSRLK